MANVSSGFIIGYNSGYLGYAFAYIFFQAQTQRGLRAWAPHTGTVKTHGNYSIFIDAQQFHIAAIPLNHGASTVQHHLHTLI